MSPTPPTPPVAQPRGHPGSVLDARDARVLLRCVGVPARYVVGYYAHESAEPGVTVVRQQDAHAWTEAWIEGVGWYTIEPTSGRIELPDGADPVAREERLWGIPTSLCIVARGDQTLHAGSVDVGGAAILIGAPGRHGKTTLVTAFHGAGFRLLAEDTTRCRPAR